MSRSLTIMAAAMAGLALGFPLASQAQSTVSIYGLMDVSAGRFQAAGERRVWRSDSGNMSTSYVGVKSVDELGGSLRAKFAIEHFVRLDQGTVGRFDGDPFWARNAYVGLQGEFGSSVIGRNTTPLFVSTLIFNAFGDSFGFSPAIRQLFTPALLPFFGDTVWNNSLAYSSPSSNNGFSVNLLGNLSEGAPGAAGRNMGANLLYFNGPLAATAAYQKVKNGAFGTPPGWTGQGTLQLGASYDLKLVKLFGQFTQVNTQASASSKTRIYGFGATLPLGDLGRVMAQLNSATASGTLDKRETTLSLGYDYLLSKNTDLYAVFMSDRVTGLNTGTTLAAGMRLRF
jgi:predicted porin